MSSAVALFVMPQEGHFRRMVPLIHGIAERGDVPYVFIDLAYREEVEGAGGRFVDLFAGRPMDEADADSTPRVCRFVSFAGCFAEDVCREVREIRPTVIAYDTFAYIGRVVAEILDVPHVNVCSGHNRYMSDLDAVMEPLRDQIAVSPDCERWVEVLRDRYGLEDASPWSWALTQSEHLNLYCEPPRYLDDEQREAYEPIAFFGSLPPADAIEARIRAGGDQPFGDRGPRIYVCFGTIMWLYAPEAVLAAMCAISEAVAERDASAIVSLGRYPAPPEVRSQLTAPNVVVTEYVNQWRALAEADVFVTHHGLNSTHEAVWSGVPMISYPLLGDQPSQAAKCAEFGFATPLAGPLEPVAKEDVHAALDRVADEEQSMRSALAAAREWEVQVMAERPAVLERMLALGSA